jgi:hypothetical protein
MVAVASLRDQLHPAVIASPGPVHDLTEDPRQQLTHAGRLGHADSSSTSRNVAAVAGLVVDRSSSARRARSARSRSSR